MKRFLLFFLLLSFLTSGVSFAEMPDYCDKTINTCEETVATTLEVTNCITQQKTAQKEYDEEKGALDEKIKEQQKLITAADSTRETCRIKAGKDNPDNFDQMIADTKICNEAWETAVINPNNLIAGFYKEIAELQRRLHCANLSAARSRINFIGNTTSSFDLSHINVGKESSLNIIENVEGETNILNRVLKLFTQVIGTFAVLMLIIGAFYMITSQGDERQLQKGKNIFFYTIIGLLIAFMSFIAVQFVISIIFTSTG